uniref:Protein kinase domain-containing protein n=1 Tax=Moniliophthora roreri TaxID=221103 RepID=A0A0W0EUD2_MONRR
MRPVVRRHSSTPEFSIFHDFDDGPPETDAVMDALDGPGIGRRRGPPEPLDDLDRYCKRPRLDGWGSQSLVEEPQRNISIDRELDRMKVILNNEVQYQKLISQNGLMAQNLLDLLQQLAEYTMPPLRSQIYKAMLRLSSHSCHHPRCLSLKHVKKLEEYPVAGGGFGDVYKGAMGRYQTTVVCLKVVKVYLTSNVEKLLSDYIREAIIWRQLKHPNVLPFVGIYYLDGSRTHLCLVSPWMERNLVEFLKNATPDDIDHEMLIFDIARGLAYLHSEKVVHGDLKGVNILMRSSDRPCIADFGLARVADSKVRRMSSSTEAHHLGTIRWLAPELLKDDGRTSKSSDMYAFGCVCYEIFSRGYPPFSNLNDWAVIHRILNLNERPSRPCDSPGLTDSMWSMIELCWLENEAARPSAEEVVAQLEYHHVKGNDTLCPDWDESLSEVLRENLDYPSRTSFGDEIEELLSQLESSCIPLDGELLEGLKESGTGCDDDICISADSIFDSENSNHVS